jgi:hypothetical protein
VIKDRRGDFRYLLIDRDKGQGHIRYLLIDRDNGRGDFRYLLVDRDKGRGYLIDLSQGDCRYLPIG